MRQLALTLLTVLLVAGLSPAAFAKTEVAQLADLEWLAGHWESDHFGETAATFMGPQLGDTRMAYYQVMSPEGVNTIMEFNTYTQTDQGIELRYAIFGPGLEPMHETPFGQTGVYLIEKIEGQSFEYVPMGESTTSFVRGSVTLEADGRLRTDTVLRKKDGSEMTVTMYATRPADQN